jgi:uncharacterized protein GlcG (DUF336 family)
MAITLSEAERVLQAAKAHAQELGIRVSICVVDPRGDLVAAVRMDGARWTTPEIAWGKAITSAMYGVPSATLQERANSPVMQSTMLRLGGRFVPQQGALPIKRGDEVIGAVGISGGPSQQDEESAQAGLDAL